jgi:hypothetical protein
MSFRTNKHLILPLFQSAVRLEYNRGENSRGENRRSVSASFADPNPDQDP